MEDLHADYSHTFESYKERSSNQSKTFIGRNDTISSGFTGKNWGEKDESLKNRKTRIKL